jgi:two-component system, OmpR family, response regulator
MRILIIEDDVRLAGLISRVLCDEKYNVDMVHDGAEGTELALRGIHDIVIVDWMLPGRDGPSIVRELRKAKLNMGILMLTARSQVEDRVTGLDSGADDYLVKPFTFDELLARLRSIGRRFNQATGDPTELRVGQIVMDLPAHTSRRGQYPLDLTKTEWDLLEFFIRHPGQSLTRQQILDYVWSYDATVRADLVDVYVSYLRQKINFSGLIDPIQTVRGIGYKLDPENA